MKGMRKMSKLFMRGTKLETTEVMMMSIPNFSKIGEGVYLSKATPKDIASAGKCIYCSDYRKSKGCKYDHCPTNHHIEGVTKKMATNPVNKRLCEHIEILENRKIGNKMV